MLSDIKKIIHCEKAHSKIFKKIEECITAYVNIFEKIDSEHKRISLLGDLGYSEPVEFPIGSIFERKNMDLDRDHFVSVPKHGFYFPLRDSLKMFLNVDGMFPAILDYIKEFAKLSAFIKNCMQATLWSKMFPEWRKNVEFTGHSITLPLLIYFDEFVAGASLGANISATKLAAVYATILCLPPYLASEHSSFLFSTSIKAEDFVKLGNKKVFSKLVDDINSLSSRGVEVLFRGETKKVFFKCFMVIGDNAGLNSIFDFVSSFNAEFCCRICIASKNQMQTMVEENENLLRTETNL